MDYFCDINDETIEIKYKSKDFRCLTQNEIEKCVRKNNTIDNPDFFKYIRYSTIISPITIPLRLFC